MQITERKKPTTQSTTNSDVPLINSIFQKFIYFPNWEAGKQNLQDTYLKWRTPPAYNSEMCATQNNNLVRYVCLPNTGIGERGFVVAEGLIACVTADFDVILLSF